MHLFQIIAACATLLAFAAASDNAELEQRELHQKREVEQWLRALKMHSIPRREMTANVTANMTALPPKQDPWYTPTPNYELTTPGTVLRIREAQGNLASTASNCSMAYNILYRTTGSDYKPTYAVTTLFVPAYPVQALLTYGIPYDSADVDASPSYAMIASVPSDVNMLLSKGYYVNVADYEGPLAAFSSGVISGHATIDAVRAVSGKFGLRDDAPSALWGYSGGALASEWAAELQVQYAPELTFAGAALGGLTPNVTSVLLTVSGGYAAGLAPVSDKLRYSNRVDKTDNAQAGIVGEAIQYPDLFETLKSRLKTSGPYNATTFLSVQNLTLAQASVVFNGQDILQYFQHGIDDIEDPLVQYIANRDGNMGYHGVPQMPIYAYKAMADKQSPIQDTDLLLTRYCGIGVNILYERNSVGGHAADAVNGHAAATAFLDSVLTGTYNKTYNTTGCTFRDVTVNITDSPY
jgi:hypothetical protein